jgi:hypothetical protein
MDIDIDCADRNAIISIFLKTVNASKIDNTGNITKHPVGIYFQNIPTDPVTNLASISYDKALEKGYYKFDFLNMTVYQNFKSRDDVKLYLNKPVLWYLFENKDILKNLIHLNSDHSSKICLIHKPKSIEELAMVIALARPSKKYLIGKDWSEVRKNIWKKEDEYFFKKSHAISYSHAIVLQLNYYVYG